MPRIKRHLRTTGHCIVEEEWTETYYYRVDLGDRYAYLDEDSIKGAGLIRVEKKDESLVSSSYTRIETTAGLKEAISTAAKGEWTFVFEIESDYS